MDAAPKIAREDNRLADHGQEGNSILEFARKHLSITPVINPLQRSWAAPW
jgi:hypothetical protein